MAQINTIVGDLEGNSDKIKTYICKAKEKETDIVIFPELAITGYPPQDLLLEKTFIRRNKELLEELISQSGGIAGVLGFVDYIENKLYNAAAVFSRNKLIAVVHKTLLPTYDVFDEDRYFTPAKEKDITPIPLSLNGIILKLGVEICEDLWDDAYDIKVTDILANKGADIIINLSSSPFYIGKRFEREKILRNKASTLKIPIFYANLVGGQDELVFDGQSLAVDRTGNLIVIGKQFEEELIIANFDLCTGEADPVEFPAYHQEQEMYNALIVGIRDYFRKTGFKKAVVGMSGGIDSSLTICIAVEALGKENVIGVSMPSKFSSDHSKADAQELAENLEICFVQIPVQNIVDTYHHSLESPLEQIRSHFGTTSDQDDLVANENIQPRTRGNCLMDISNRLKELYVLVLNTGNKTELALGYCTLYGDMAGGIGAIGDVSKLEVYKLAKYVNEKAGRDLIPRNVLEKTPSAELRENQFDPFDFDIVSPLVDEIIENRRSKQDLIEKGYSPEIVKDTYRRIRLAEFKRWQAAPCIKITRKAFGIGWKMPIVNKYEG
jgi:NAD+ synthase (glutamine-hydrolysing)